MDEVAKIGVEVEYWDISSLFFKNNFNQEDSSALVNTRKFQSYNDLKGALSAESDLADTLFISLMTFEGRIGKLYRMLSKFNCKLAVFAKDTLPLPPPNADSMTKRIGRVNLAKLKSFFETKIVKWQKRIGKIKQYDILFMGGNTGWHAVGNIDYSEVAQAEIVKVNSSDYDRFLLARDAEPLLTGDYILFLDEYLPLHPDASLFGIDNITAEEYYPELCNYFKRVELQFGMPVVIAAHPKALQYKEEDFFDGRKIYFGKSAELSKYASFVLAHDSTSISYPIAFGKRLHFITSKNIEKGINSVHRCVVYFASFLGCNCQWFDRDEPIELVKEVPEEDYKTYKYDFQTWVETENKLSSEIFVNFFKDR